MYKISSYLGTEWYQVRPYHITVPGKTLRDKTVPRKNTLTRLRALTRSGRTKPDTLLPTLPCPPVSSLEPDSPLPPPAVLPGTVGEEWGAETIALALGHQSLRLLFLGKGKESITASSYSENPENLTTDVKRPAFHPSLPPTFPACILLSFPPSRHLSPPPSSLRPPSPPRREGNTEKKKRKQENKRW